MERPLLSKLDSWANHEARVLEVVGLALKLLRDEDNLPTQEDGINRKLYFCIHRANYELSKVNKGLSCPPSYDSKNAPDADDKERAQREDKRPDFVCGFYDFQESNPDKSAKHYVIECKRLGTNSGTWVLNTNYVVHGVCRFVNPEWGYGKSAKSGAMVGYIQDMKFEDILKEVNAEIQKQQLEAICLSTDGWKDSDVSNLVQYLTRPKIHPKNFCLQHLWLDIRNN